MIPDHDINRILWSISQVLSVVIHPGSDAEPLLDTIAVNIPPSPTSEDTKARDDSAETKRKQKEHLLDMFLDAFYADVPALCAQEIRGVGGKQSFAAGLTAPFPSRKAGSSATSEENSDHPLQYDLYGRMISRPLTHASIGQPSSSSGFTAAEVAHRPPAMPSAGDVERFLVRVFKLGNFAGEVAVLSLVLLNRLLLLRPAQVVRRHPLQAGSWRLFTLTAILVAQKFHDDRYLTNADFPALYFYACDDEHWSRGLGKNNKDPRAVPAFPSACRSAYAPVPNTTMPRHLAVRLTKGNVNALERAFVDLLNWNVNVPPSLFERCHSELQWLIASQANAVAPSAATQAPVGMPAVTAAPTAHRGYASASQTTADPAGGDTKSVRTSRSTASAGSSVTARTSLSAASATEQPSSAQGTTRTDNPGFRGDRPHIATSYIVSAGRPDLPAPSLHPRQQPAQPPPQQHVIPPKLPQLVVEPTLPPATKYFPSLQAQRATQGGSMHALAQKQMYHALALRKPIAQIPATASFERLPPHLRAQTVAVPLQAAASIHTGIGSSYAMQSLRKRMDGPGTADFPVQVSAARRDIVGYAPSRFPKL
jgi:hypothetical protein